MCPHDDFEIIYYKNEITIRRCSDCGLFEIRIEKWTDIGTIVEPLKKVASILEENINKVDMLEENISVFKCKKCGENLVVVECDEIIVEGQLAKKFFCKKCNEYADMGDGEVAGGKISQLEEN